MRTLKSRPVVREVQTFSLGVVDDGDEVLAALPNGLTAELTNSGAINLLGTAKFRFSPAPAFQVRTPMTFPSMTNSGPPLFPCDAGAVVNPALPLFICPKPTHDA